MTFSSQSDDYANDLAALNQVLRALGQAPASSINTNNVEHKIIQDIINQCVIDLCNEGWNFNVEQHVELTADSSGRLDVTSYLSADLHDGQTDRMIPVRTEPVSSSRYLYDLEKHSYTEFTVGEKYYVDVTRLLEYSQLPDVFKRYVNYRASTLAAAQLNGNPELYQMLQQQELYARAACMEYECNVGDHSFMGWPAGTVYRAYQPYRTLQR
tara:strand:- start:8327 stop:8962 length:636 start_codon:yes stop_codon:yes gene_type:complete